MKVIEVSSDDQSEEEDCSMPIRFRARMIVAVGDNGQDEPDLYFCIVECTEQDVAAGRHYKRARAAAAVDNSGPFVAFDEYSSAGKSMLPLFAWRSASVFRC